MKTKIAYKFLPFVLLMLVMSCSKKDDVAPNASAAVQGTYKISRFKFDAPGTADDIDLNLPASNGSQQLSGVIQVTPGSTDTEVNIMVVLSETGEADQTSDFGEFDLKKNGSSYDIMDGATKVGITDGTNLTINSTSTDGTLLLVSKK